MLTTDNKLKIDVKGSPISNEKIVTLLGVAVDNKLSFFLKKVSQKLHTLAGVSKFISKKKLRVIMKAFKTLQFSYSPLVWICHRTLNKKNKLHERALQLVYSVRISAQKLSAK